MNLQSISCFENLLFSFSSDVFTYPLDFSLFWTLNLLAPWILIRQTSPFLKDILCLVIHFTEDHIKKMHSLCLNLKLVLKIMWRNFNYLNVSFSLRHHVQKEILFKRNMWRNKLAKLIGSSDMEKNCSKSLSDVSNSKIPKKRLLNN